MKKKIPPGTRGKVVLRSVPTPEAAEKAAALLHRLAGKTPPEKIRAAVANPPAVLFRNLPVEKGRKVVAALEKAGAQAVFVPLRPGELQHLSEKQAAPRPTPSPVRIVAPPGRLRRKILRAGLAGLLLIAAAVALTVELFPVLAPEGLLRPAAPPTAGLTGFFPVDANAPEMASVSPTEMPAALALQYRLSPDRRFIGALQVVLARFSGPTAPPYSLGRVSSDGRRLRIPVLAGGDVHKELHVDQPLRFASALSLCRDLLSLVCGQTGPAECRPAQTAADPSLAAALDTADPLQLLDALSLLESHRKQSGPTRALFGLSALGCARLVQALRPDPLDAGDRIASYGLAFLAAAGASEPPGRTVRAEAELAWAMGYTAHAAAVAAQHPSLFSDPYGRVLAACLQADPDRISAALADAPADRARVLAARTYRRLAMADRSREAAAALAGKGPWTHPARVDIALSAASENAAEITAEYTAGVLSGLFAAPDRSLDGGIVSLPRLPSLLAATAARRGIPGRGLFIDGDRAATVFAGIYAHAALARFHALLDGDAAAAERYAAALAGADRSHPLWLYMDARIAQATANRSSAAEAAAKLIRRDGAPPDLCARAYRLVSDRQKRLALAPLCCRRMDGRPAYRFLLAGIEIDIWHDDEAEKRLGQALALNPLHGDGYRSLCRVKGSAAPLENAAAKHPERFWLLGLAGDFWAGQNAAPAPMRALACYRQIRSRDPDSPAWHRKTADVLDRLGRHAEAAAVLEGVIARGGGQGRRFDPNAARLAEIYLDQNRPEKALALAGPETADMGPEPLMVAARANEMMGRYPEAFRLYARALKRGRAKAPVAAGCAAFNWRMGRYRQAAALVSAAGLLAEDASGGYAGPFVAAFKTASAKEIRGAVDALKDKGVPDSQVRRIALRFEAAGRLDIAAGLLEAAPGDTAVESAEAAAAAARIIGREKGPAAARASVAPHAGGPMALPTAAALFDQGLYALAAETVSDPPSFPPPLQEAAWLLLTASQMAAGVRAENLAPEIAAHYRGTWAQRKRAQVTGILSDDPLHAAGRHLMGMIPVEEMMAWARMPAHRCALAWCAGFVERGRGRYPDAAKWYMVSRTVGTPEAAAYRWASSALFWWSCTGTDHRHRSLAEDRRRCRETKDEIR